MDNSREINLREEVKSFFDGTDFGNEKFHILLQRKIRLNTNEPPYTTKIVCTTCNHSYDNRGREGCPDCFTEDAFVTTRIGYKKIKDVIVGEYVLTRDGTYNKVLRTFEKEYSGELVSIKSGLRSEELTCTLDHQWFVIKKDNFRFRKFLVEESRAHELEVGDYLLMPKIQDIEINDLQQIIIGDNRTVNLTDELLWTFGLWCAEGHIAGDRDIYWSLHVKEEEYAARVESAMLSAFPDCRVRHILHPDKNVRQVAVAKTDVAKWFKAQFGSGCENKRFPDWIMHLPKERAFFALSGLWAGDGSTTHIDKDRMTDRCSLGMTSREIIYQAQWILWRNGRYAGLSTNSPAGKRQVWRVEWVENRISKFSAKYLAEFNDFWGTKITSIEKKHSDTKVYDLKVENNASFVVNNTLTHNCDGVGYLWDEKLIIGYMYRPQQIRLSDQYASQIQLGRNHNASILLITPYKYQVGLADIIYSVESNDNGGIIIPISKGIKYMCVAPTKARLDFNKIEFNTSVLTEVQ